MQYMFGDTDIAAHRLKVLAEVYAASTRAFLCDAVTCRPRIVLDLGCGPGHTTHLLSDVLDSSYALGLDNSEHFIALAEQTRTAEISFCWHDVTTVPFPAKAGDLLYSRLLLAHLRDPRKVLLAWATQMRPKGLLLLEEVEWIETSSAVFTTYLEIVTALLAQQSTNMYAGQDLHKLQDPEQLRRRTSQVQRVPVTSAHAATMFFLNMQTWKQQPFIQAHYASSLIDLIEQELHGLIEGSHHDAEIEWGMRQLVYERV